MPYYLLLQTLFPLTHALLAFQPQHFGGLFSLSRFALLLSFLFSPHGFQSFNLLPTRSDFAREAAPTAQGR